MSKEEELKRLGKRIKEIRMTKGLSQAKLGLAVLKDQQSIHKLEAGEFNPTFIYLQEIAKGLEMSVSELLDF